MAFAWDLRDGTYGGMVDIVFINDGNWIGLSQSMAQGGEGITLYNISRYDGDFTSQKRAID